MTTIWSKIKRAIKDPCMRFGYMRALGLTNAIPDKRFLEKEFYFAMHKKLNVEDPKTFNEKLQWLKLYNRDPRYTIMVDKYKAREYVKETIGEEYLIPLLGVWDNPEQINFETLPDQFVLKCNHNSGTGMYICKNKNEMDIDKVKKRLWKGLKEDYYLLHREWPYKDVPRKIIAEKYMSEPEKQSLTDYKLMCFDGRVEYSFTCTNRFGEGELYVNFYDREWNPMPFIRKYPKNPVEIKKPRDYEKMVQLAEKVSQGIPFLRVDFYECAEKLYWGEFTFFPGAGIEEFYPEEWDYKLGEMITIDKQIVED